jgi:hypothetical protein
MFGREPCSVESNAVYFIKEKDAGLVAAGCVKNIFNILFAVADVFA